MVTRRPHNLPPRLLWDLQRLFALEAGEASNDAEALRLLSIANTLRAFVTLRSEARGAQ
jgi:hypothetical protein